MIKFSIITCTYNAAKELPRTLQSVAEQQYDDIEHIIIDGKSKDDTLQIIKEYAAVAAANRIIIYTSEPDKGLYDAMNKGIQRVTGNYVIFLNAGDKFHNAQTLHDVATQLQADALPGVVYGNTDIVDDEGKYIGPRHLKPPTTLTWRSFSNGMLVCHQAFYARTDIAKRTPYDLQYRLSADVDWCIRVMKTAEEQALTLYNTQLVLCDYLAGGMSIKNHRASLIERFNIMRKHYGLIKTVIRHITFIFRK